MKVEAIFSSAGTPVIRLWPETDGERRLLGSVLTNHVIGHVEMRHAGHESDGKASLVQITLTDPKKEVSA